MWPAPGFSDPKARVGKLAVGLKKYQLQPGVTSQTKLMWCSCLAAKIASAFQKSNWQRALWWGGELPCAIPDPQLSDFESSLATPRSN